MKEEKDEKGVHYEDENNESLSVDVKKKLEKLKEELKQCQQEKQQNLAGWQRAQADFVNFRRRQEEQMEEWSKMFSGGLINDILPVLDTLEASINNGQSEEFKMIKSQLMKILGQHGLTEMKAVGEKFDHNLHEAVETVESEGEEGQIVEEIQKGYLLNGKVLRIAKVKVSK
jgi:molecular chaperone GrpE